MYTYPLSSIVVAPQTVSIYMRYTKSGRYYAPAMRYKTGTNEVE